MWLFSQSNSAKSSNVDQILESFDDTFTTPKKTFSKFILSLKKSDLLMYISCMSSQRKREMIQTNQDARDFDQSRLEKAVAGFKKKAMNFFSVEDVCIQESPPKIIFISTSIRGSLFIKEKTTLSFSKEDLNWLISDIQSESIEKRKLK